MISSNKIDFIKSDNIYRFKCPHCNIIIEVEQTQLNCKIFRCGILKHTGKQIDPHSTKKQCELLIEQGSVWGCCKPFKIINNLYVEICDYI